MWERLTAPEDVFSKLQRDNLAIFESYWATLMEIVCRDACDGYEIGRVRAGRAGRLQCSYENSPHKTFLAIFMYFRCWLWPC